MSYSQRPAPGQATMANSEPVVIASDQTAIPGSAEAADSPSIDSFSRWRTSEPNYVFDA